MLQKLAPKIGNVLMLLLAIIWLVPLVWMTVTAFRPRAGGAVRLLVGGFYLG